MGLYTNFLDTTSYSGASSDNWHWTRSARRGNTSYFYYVNSNGSCGSDGNVGYPICPKPFRDKA